MQHKNHYIGDWIAFYGNAMRRIRVSMDGTVMGMSLLLKALPPKTQTDMIRVAREHCLLPDK